MSSSQPRSITSSFQRVNIGGHDNDFGIPQSPPSSTNPWTLHVNRHRENSPTRNQKPRTSDVLGHDAIGDVNVPSASSANMRRRASCPDFQVPDFKLSGGESTRLLNKRPSIVSQSVIEKFRQGQGERLHVMKAPIGSSISEQPEIAGTDLDNSPCPVALTEKPQLLTDQNAVVPSQQRGFLMSKVSSMFTAQQPSQKPTDFTAVGVTAHLDTTDAAAGAAVMPPKKKSYFARRAAAITNADVNVMAPTSL